MALYEVTDYYDRTETIQVERTPARQALLALFGYARQATQREADIYWQLHEAEAMETGDTAYPWFPYEEGEFYDPRLKDHLS